MFTIRRANKNDIELIHSLGDQAFRATYAELLSQGQIDYMLDWMYSIPNLEKQMDNGHIYHIGSCDGEDCAYISFEKQGEHLYHLQKIYILPKYQSCGMGSYMFDEGIKFLRTLEGESGFAVELNVNRDNKKALAFYARKGMKKVFEGDFDIGRGYLMTDYIMRLDCPSTSL